MAEENEKLPASSPSSSHEGSENDVPLEDKEPINNSSSPIQQTIDKLEVKKEAGADDSEQVNATAFILKCLKCPICKCSCPSQREWDEHITKHGLPLRCFYCQDVLPDVTALGKHRDECCKKGRLRGCSHCGKTFSHLEVLLTHEYLVHPTSYKQKTNSLEKIRESFPQTTYTCSVCYEKREGFQSMQRHLSDHLESLRSEGKDLNCNVCSIVFVSRAALSTHISSPRHRERVMRIKNLFKCNHCGTVFPSRDSYAMHMLDIAREETENDLTRRTIGLFVAYNPVLTRSPKEVREKPVEEETTHPSENSDDTNVPLVAIKQEPIDPNDETSQNLDSCDGTSNQNGDGDSQKEAPTNLLHNMINADGYKCGLCKKVLEDQDSFAMHMMYHARAMEEQHQKQRIIGKISSEPLDLRPIKREPGEAEEEVTYGPSLGVVCPHCLVPFVTRDALAMHMMEEHADKTHTPSTNRIIRGSLRDASPQPQPSSISYPCQVCGRSFRDQDTLAMHMLMHSQSELLLLAQKPTSSLNLSELSGSPRSSQRTSPSQTDEWQRSVLNALYKDLPGIHPNRNKCKVDQKDGGHSESTSVRSSGSVSECHFIQANVDSDGSGRLRSCSVDTLNSENQQGDDFSPGQYDRNVIIYDKHGQKWTCSICCIEFRSLISVTRHLGHVSHKLEMDRRLRDTIMMAKAADWSNSRADTRDTSMCRKCGRRFTSTAELSVHVALLCGRESEGHLRQRFGSASMNGRVLTEDGKEADNRPRSTQSCYERSFTPGLVCRRRRSEDLNYRESRFKLRRMEGLFSSDTVSNPADNRKPLPSHFGLNLNSRKLFSPTSHVGSFTHGPDIGRSKLPSEGGSNTDNESSADMMDFILKQKDLFMCKFCKIIFTDKTVYYLHMGLHNLNNPWQCNLCGKPCADVHEFSSHVIHY